MSTDGYILLLCMEVLEHNQTATLFVVHTSDKKRAACIKSNIDLGIRLTHCAASTHHVCAGTVTLLLRAQLPHQEQDARTEQSRA